MIKKILGIITTLSILFSVAPLSASAYTVERGDTLSALAREFGTTVSEIAEMNGLSNPDRIFVGQELSIPGEEDSELLGAGYTPVTAYVARTTSFISGSATTIPVNTTRDKAGNAIVLSNISSSSTVKVYMSIEAGLTKEEIVYCTGVTSISWTGCVRGLSFQGGSETASTTLAFSHNAGSSIQITDVGQFFNQYVSVDGIQQINDIKTFTTYPKFAVTTTLPTLNSEFATKQYVDTVGAGGFTSLNVSTTRGLSVDGSAPERVGINTSSTSILAFDSAGKYYANVSTTQGLTVVGSQLQFDQAATLNLTGNVTSSGTFRVGAPVTVNDAVPKIYVDNGIYFLSATTTADQTVTAGRAIFATSTNYGAHTNTSAVSSTFLYIGLAATGGTNGQTITYTRPGGINCSQSGLTVGADYFLNGTAGQISTTAATNNVRIGRALTTTCIQVDAPKMVIRGNATISASGAVTYQTGFYPSIVKIHAVGVDGGFSYGDQNNRSSFCKPRSGVPYIVCGVDSTNIYTTYNSSSGAESRTGTIARNTYGFVLTTTDGAGAEGLDIYWEATN